MCDLRLAGTEEGGVGEGEKERKDEMRRLLLGAREVDVAVSFAAADVRNG